MPRSVKMAGSSADQANACLPALEMTRAWSGKRSMNNGTALHRVAR
jgi:hypothetical protein